MSTPSFSDRLKALPKSHPGYKYYFGATLPLASQADQRFSYYLHIPESHSFDATKESEKLPLLVLIHGTTRKAESLRNSYSTFAETNSCALLVPFFPAGIFSFDDLDSYKLLSFKGIRFDSILLSMISEVASIYSIQSERFYLAGFSGGGQFVNRFLCLHPERVKAIVIGAQGKTTLPDEEEDWPDGVKNVGEVFGDEYREGLKWEEIAKVPIHWVCGGMDNNPKDILSKDGIGRLDKLKLLKNELEKKGVGIGSEMVVVEGVAHSQVGTMDAFQSFLAKEIAKER